MKAMLAVAIGAVLSSAAVAQDQKAIIAGVDGTFAPFVMPKLGGGVEGFTVDMLNELNKQTSRKIEIFVGQFSGLIPAMNAGQIGFIGAPVTVTQERAENLLLSEPYLTTYYTFIIPAKGQDVATLDDLKGKTVAVNRGSSYDQWAQQHAAKYGFKVESFGTTADATQAVLSGRANAQLLGNAIGAFATTRSGGKVRLASATVDDGKVFAAAFRKGDPATRKEVEMAIECLKQNGTMAKLYQKWFGETPKAGSPAVTIYPGLGVPGMPGHDATPHSLACK